MRPLNIDLSTLLGVAALFLVKAMILGRYKWPRDDWQRWVVATAVGLAVAVTSKVFLR